MDSHLLFLEVVYARAWFDFLKHQGSRKIEQIMLDQSALLDESKSPDSILEAMA